MTTLPAGPARRCHAELSPLRSDLHISRGRWSPRAIALGLHLAFLTVLAWPVRGQDHHDWPMAAKDYAQTRFSGLDQVSTKNVKDLKVAWTFSTGVNRGQEAAPIVVGEMMYVVTPYPNILYALDLKQSGAVRWKYEPKPAAAAQGVACCDFVNRGAAVSEGRVFYNTLDCHTVAVDARTGKEL